MYAIYLYVYNKGKPDTVRFREKQTRFGKLNR